MHNAGNIKKTLTPIIFIYNWGVTGKIFITISKVLWLLRKTLPHSHWQLQVDMLDPRTIQAAGNLTATM